MIWPTATILLICWLTLTCGHEYIPEPRRIVALGDLHGDYGNTLSILQFTNLTDAEGQWIGKDAVLVQTGDIVDRGADTIKLYSLMKKLTEEARLAGGQVVQLLGNHEVMNMIGDWRYVTSSDIETFGGIDARRAAFAPKGWIGSYLLSLNMTAKVDTTVFCHGGIHPSFAKHGIDWINQATHQDFPGLIEAHGHSGDIHGVFGVHGPTWYRGYALDEEASVCPILDRALASLDAERMVIGHTVQEHGHIATRCDGKAILIDIGISRSYFGHVGALELVGDQVTAVYGRNKRVPLASPFTRQSPRQHYDEL